MDKIEHHHLLLRIETQLSPKKSDKDKISKLLHTILHDIKMEPLGSHEMFYVEKPKYNEGLTAIQAIQTSHIAFHFWKNPVKDILKSKKSSCLLQLDIYTCGSLSKEQISIVLHALTRFKPTHADVTLLNRKWSLKVDSHDTWSDESPWVKWIDDRY